MKQRLKVALVSDFKQEYDYMFYSDKEPNIDVLWRRYAKEKTLSKKEQFKLFADRNLNIPLIDTSAKLFERVKAGHHQVVVYLDQYAHRGEEKILTSLAEAIENYPDKLVSEFINTGNKEYQSQSYRFLVIGNKYFWLQYRNKESWKSNVGENVEITVLHAGNVEDFIADLKNFNCYDRIKEKFITLTNDLVINRWKSPFKDYPMYAIDFIVKEELPLSPVFAIDFNTAPGIKGVDLNLSKSDIYDSVEEFFRWKIKKENQLINLKDIQVVIEEGSWYECFQLADNPALTEAQIHQLASHPNVKVAYKTVCNRYCSFKTFKLIATRLLTLNDSFTGCTIAEHLITYEGVLTILAKNRCSSVLDCLLSKENLPLSILNILINHENPLIKKKAQQIKNERNTNL